MRFKASPITSHSLARSLRSLARSVRTVYIFVRVIRFVYVSLFILYVFWCIFLYFLCISLKLCNFTHVCLENAKLHQKSYKKASWGHFLVTFGSPRGLQEAPLGRRKEVQMVSQEGSGKKSLFWPLFDALGSSRRRLWGAERGPKTVLKTVPETLRISMRLFVRFGRLFGPIWTPKSGRFEALKAINAFLQAVRARKRNHWKIQGNISFFWLSINDSE